MTASGGPAPGQVVPGGPGPQWPALLVALVGGLVVWIVAGAPWWAPAALLAGGLAGRLVAVLVPARYRPLLVRLGVAAALGWLVVQLSPPGWLAVAGLLVLVAVLLGIPRRLLLRAGGPWGRRRIFGVGVAVVLLVGAAAGTAVERTAAQRARDADYARAGNLSRAATLPTSMSEVLMGMLRAIADDDPRRVCRVFSPAAAAQLAAAHGAVDCADAVHRLHAQVRDPATYTRPDRESFTSTLAPDGQSATSDGCALTWTGLPRLLDPGPSGPAAPPPGPAPGQLDGQRQLGQGFSSSTTGCVLNPNTGPDTGAGSRGGSVVPRLHPGRLHEVDCNIYKGT